MRWPFWLLFRDLFRRSIFRCILVALWLTLGSILAPFGSLLAPFWLPLAPFGSLLAPFGSLLAPFGSHFCSLWLTFCSFWLTFTPFSHFGRLLASFLVPFRYFQRKSNEKSCFSMFFSEFPTFYAPASAKHLQTNRRNPSFAQRQIFAYIYLSRPGADNCRRQLRSAPGLLGCPSGVLAFEGNVSFLSLFLFFCFFSFCLFSCSLPSLPKVKQDHQDHAKINKNWFKNQLFSTSIFGWFFHGF